MKIIIAEADRELCSDLCARLRKRLPASSLEVVDDGRGLVERVMSLMRKGMVSTSALAA